MVGFLFVGGILSLVLLFVVWWCVERLPYTGALGEIEETLFKEELILSYADAVRAGDIALQDQLEALARDYSIELS